MTEQSDPTNERDAPQSRQRFFTPGVLTLLLVLALAAFVLIRLWPLDVLTG